MSPLPSTFSDLQSAVAPLLAEVTPPRPHHARPIIIIGAGGIVRAAHLPAYRKAAFPVIALMDPVPGKAEALALESGVTHSFHQLKDVLRFAPVDAVFDIAVPASQLLRLLPHLPDEAVVLLQKPLGETLAEARAIRTLCEEKNFIASVNFSLRYSPNNLAVVALERAGYLGEVHDLEVQTRTYTPWHLWSFLATAPRLEILYHSIHYLDLVRSWFGDPVGVYAKTVKNPQSKDLAPTRSTIILDYGPSKRVLITTNHSHEFGPAHQESFVQWEGMAGAARIGMGINLNYPSGVADTLEYAPRGNTEAHWLSLPVSGNNIPDAFIGSMGALQAFAEGSATSLPSNIEDAYRTMALVEACYRSSERSPEPIPLED